MFSLQETRLIEEGKSSSYPKATQSRGLTQMNFSPFPNKKAKEESKEAK